MKFDKQKAFPYPVLRPLSDDYRDVEFQTTVEFVVGKDAVRAKINYAISSEEIVEQIEKENAEYVSIISCRDTYFRAVVTSASRQAEREFSIGDLRGEVRVDPYVYVKKEITDFASPDINPEFGKGPFRFEAGDILAQDEPQVFFIDRDLFKPITSVFDLVKRDDLENGHWVIDFGEDHIQIQVSPSMKESIDDARNSHKNRMILVNSIYFAAVMEAVQKLKESLQEYSGRKWADVIVRQAHNWGCDLENHESYIIAQRLMRYPLARLESYVFKEK